MLKIAFQYHELICSFDIQRKVTISPNTYTEQACFGEQNAKIPYNHRYIYVTRMETENRQPLELHIL